MVSRENDLRYFWRIVGVRGDFEIVVGRVELFLAVSVGQKLCQFVLGQLMQRDELILR